VIVSQSVTVRVPAKINLQLAVGPLRPDGYHDLVTVFHAISLFDEVTVAVADDDDRRGVRGGVPPGDDRRGVRGGVPPGDDSVTVTGEGVAEVPADGDNLALRAVRALRDAVTGREAVAVGDGAAVPLTPQAPAVRVAIAKKIPVAGGMAGGSADAAAAIVACDALWGTGLSLAELSDVAAQVGSDVAFALLGGTAVGRGRGEQLTPALVAPASYHWVLAFASGHLSTPLVYKTLDTQRVGRMVQSPELSHELMGALRAGDPLRLGRALSNDLQAPALALFPALRKTLTAGREAGALGALVSGSGPTCLFLARDADHATELAVQLSGADVCRTVARAAGPVPGATVVSAEG
jgi:4-diphosphocytidyl-2-C-methyl-D-erythritol kinase